MANETFTVNQTTNQSISGFDVDGDGVVDPTELVVTTVTITNNSDNTDATGVQFSEILDLMTIVNQTGNDINVSPIAFNDSFTAVGNTMLVVGNATAPSTPHSTAAGSVIANDIEFFGDTFVISAFDAASTGGGTVSMVTTGPDAGSFTYVSAAGFNGTDTFTYTITDKGLDGVVGGGDDLTSVGTVSITVTGRVWYVDSAAAGGGNGTSTNPFNTITAGNLNGAGGAGDVDSAGDYIYIKGTPTGPLALENNQHLIGTGDALFVNSITLAADTGTNSTLSTSSGTALTLASGNEVAGINVTNTNGIAVTGVAVGTLTFHDVNLTSTTGQALALSTSGTFTATGSNSLTATNARALDANNITLGDAGVTFQTVNSSGGDYGLILQTFSQTAASTGFDVLGGTISGKTVNAVRIDLTSADVAIAASLSDSVAGRTVSVTNSGSAAAGGNQIVFTGAIDENGLGILLDNNDANNGTTISFSGGLDIDSTTNTGFTATNGGTVNVTGSNTIDTTTGRLVNMSDVSVGASGVTFGSLTATGTVANTAILLSNVDGAGNTFSGGTVGINSTSGVASDGIRIDGGSAATFTFGSTAIGSTGDEGIELNGANGVVTFSSITVDASAGQGVEIRDATSTVNINGGNIGANDDPTGHSLQIVGGTGAINIAANINKGSANNVVFIDDHETGTVALSGNVTTVLGGGGIHIEDVNSGAINFTGQTIELGTGTNAGVDLVNNNGGAINFNMASGGNGLDITTTSGTGFNATGGGTVTVIDAAGASSNTISSTSGTALNFAGTNIGAGDLTFEKISAGNAGANTTDVGISLVNTGTAGGLKVTGNGTNIGATGGGVIQRMTGVDGSTTEGIGIYLNNTSEVSLNGMLLQNFDNLALFGQSVGGIKLTNSTIGGTIGTSTGSNDAPVAFGTTDPGGTNGFLTGSSSQFDNVNISGSIEHNFEIYQQSGTFNLTIENSNIHDNSALTGSDGLLIETSGTAHGIILVEDTIFDDNKSQAVQANALGSSHLELTLDDNDILSTTQGNEGFILQNGASGDLTVAVTNNTFTGINGTNILVGNVVNNANTAAEINATVSGNVMTLDGPAVNRTLIAFFSSTAGNTPTSKVVIDGNTINTIADPVNGLAESLFVSTPDAGTDPLVYVQVSNNTVNIDDDNLLALRGIAVQSTQDTSTMHADVRGNDVNYLDGAPPGVNGIRVRQVAPATLDLEPGVGGANAAAVLAANNPLSTTEVVGTVTVSANNSTVLLPSTPATPSLPSFLAAAPGGVEAATPYDPDKPQETVGTAPPTDDASPDGKSDTPPPTGGPEVTPDTLPALHPVIVDDGVLSQAEVNYFVDAAIQRWIDAGLTTDQLAAIKNLSFAVGDMAGLNLGSYQPGLVTLDADAAGHGWYLDGTPLQDSEFGNVQSATRLATDPTAAPAGHYDLLTTVMHEMGHALGIGDQYADSARDELMFGWLYVGERRLPGADDADGAVVGSITTEEFAGSPISVGPFTLPFGKTVTIQWHATVDAQTNQLIDNPVNVGTVTATNGVGFADTGTGNITTVLDTLVLGGTIWNDNGAGMGGIGGNGIKDGSEPGVAGVTLSLFVDAGDDNTPDTPGTPLVTGVLTDGSGNYSFTGLAPGNYIVRVDADNFVNSGGVDPFVALAGLQISPVTSPDYPDPDNNVDNDDNGGPHTTGTDSFSKTITLAYNTETTADGTGKLDINTTLDLGFLNNPPPDLTNLAGSVTFTEDGPAILLDSGTAATVTDDQGHFNGGSLTVSITANEVTTEDVLGINQIGGVTLSLGTSVGSVVSVGGNAIGTISSDGTGGSDLVVALNTNDATPARVSTLIQALTYTNTNTTNPSTNPRTVSVTVNDGLSGSDFENVTVNITPVNDAPILTTSAGTTAFTEGNNVLSTPVAVDPTLTVTDPDGPGVTFTSAKIWITSGFNAQDVLAFNNTSAATFGDITTATSAGTNTLTLTGTAATQTQWQNALRAVTYTNLSEAPDTTTRTVSFFVSDGAAFSYETHTQITLQNSSQSIAIGFVDAGSTLDLVIANLGDEGTGVGGNTVSVLRGNGDGTFAAPVHYATGTNPSSVILVDVNDDTFADIITTNYISNTVSVLLNQGNGTFAAAITSATGVRPYDVTFCDFNADGNIDLATANRDSATVSILLGDSTGSFTAQSPISVGTAGSSVTIAIAEGDINGDLISDIVVVNELNNQLRVLLGNGSGGFGDGTFTLSGTPLSTGNTPFDLLINDFDGDFDLDIAVVNIVSEDVTVLLNNGSGTFSGPVSYGVGVSPISIYATDFNSDGELDLVVANAGSADLSVLLGNGNGTFQPQMRFAVGSGPFDAVAGDFDENGQVDLAAPNINNDNVSILLFGTKDVSVTEVNDTPTVTTSAGTTAFTEGADVVSTPVVIDGAIDLNDVDSSSLATATVSITGNFAGAQDVLAFTAGAGMGNIAFTSYVGGVLTLTSSGGSATIAEWETALKSVTYTNTSDTPNTSLRTISFAVNDGTSTSTAGTKDVSVAAANDTPTVTTSAGTTAFTEGNNVASTPVAIDGAIDLNDVDSATLATATITISNNFQSLEDVLAFTNGAGMGNVAFTSYAGGVLTLTSALATATVAEWETALKSVTYTNTSDTPNTATRTISFAVNDGAATSTAGTKDVSITAVNDTPTVTTSGGNTAFVEGADVASTPVVIDNAVDLNDVDTGTLATATVSITANFESGADVLAFTNGAGMGNIAFTSYAGGVLTLTSAGATATITEWETALQSVTFTNTSDTPSTLLRTVSFAVNDGNSTSAAGTKNVSVAAANDTPINAVPASIGVTEDVASPLTGIVFSDVDAGGSPVVATLSVPSGSLAAGSSGTVTVGGTSSAMTLTGTVADINAFIAGSNVTFTTALNATANVNLTVMLDDQGNTGPGGVKTDTDIVTLAVTAVNDAPVFAGLGPSNAFIEGGASVSLDNNNNAAVSDVELDALGNYGGAVLTLVRNGGANPDDVFLATGTLDISSDVSLGGPAIGTAVNADGQLQITFNAFATPGDVDDVLRQIIYSNVGEDPPTSVQINYTLNDGNAGSQGTVAIPGIGSGSVTVGITPVNDRPILTSVSPAASYTVGSPGTTLSAPIGVTDVDSNAPPTDGIVNAVVRIQDFFLGDELFVNLPILGGFFSVDGGFTPTNISVQSNSLGMLVLSGMDTPTIYQQVLAAVQYRSTNADPSAGGSDPQRTITWQVNDGTVASPLFSAQTSYGTAVSPQSVATADLDGDGALDLVTANLTGNNVSVLFGLGTTDHPGTPGTFGAATNFAAGTGAQFVAIGEFNGDTNFDLAVANNTGGFSILLGAGAGAFGAATNFAAGTAPVALALGDFNKDGNTDVAVANNGSSNVSVRLGTGTGSFGAATNFLTGSGPTAVAVGDFNRDGNTDLAVSDQGANDVAILLGNGIGGFGAATTFGTGVGTGPRSLATADFNADGFLDLVTANQTAGNVSVLLGNGSGGFGGASTFASGTGTYNVAVGDINADGKFDIVATNSGAANMSVLLGNGSGSFAAAVTFGTGTSPFSVALADLNNDGGLDLAVANSGAATVSVLLNAGTNMSNVGTTLLAFNAPAVVDLDVSGAGTGFTTSYTENGAPIAIADSDLSIDDPDAVFLQSVAVELTNAKAGDVLSLAGALPAGIDSTLDTSVPGKITLRLVNPATIGDYTTALSLVRFSSTSENPDTTDRDITVVANDGEADGPAAHATIHVFRVNDAPVNTVPGAQAVNEDTNLAISGLVVGDVDAAAGGLTTTLSVLHGTLTVASAGGAAVAGSGTASVVLTGTLAQINTTLAAAGNVVYRGTLNYNGPDTLTVLTDDGGNTGTGGVLSDSDTVAITVNPVNDAPVAANGAANGNEDTMINGTLVATDVDNASLTYSLVAAASFGSVTVNADGTFSYTPAANYNGSDSFTFRASDGSLDSNTATINVSVAPVNDAPVLGGVPGNRATPPGGAALNVAPGVTVGDIDNTTFASATVRVTAGTFAGDGNVLAANTAGTSIGAIYDAATETLTLSGVDTLAHYQQVLASVTFQTTTVNPTNSGLNPTRTIEWQLDDGSGVNNLSNIQSTVIGVAKPPPGDFNGDGRSDILWQNNNGAPAVWLLDGTTVSAFGPLLPNPNAGLPIPAGGGGQSGLSALQWQVIESGDFNGDGKADILWQSHDGPAAVWLMDGTSPIAFGAALPNPGPAWHAKEAADFNADGKADILWQNDSGAAAVWLMDGTNASAFGAALPNPGPSWHVSAAADFNADGKADILWQDDSGVAAVWLMDGTNASSFGAALPNPGPTWHVKEAADFNGDGKADILWQNDGGAAAIWLMDGTNASAFGAALPNPGPTWHVKEAGDTNGDGMADILWQNDDGTPAVWLMNSTTVLSFGAALPNPDASWHII